MTYFIQLKKSSVIVLQKRYLKTKVHYSFANETFSDCIWLYTPQNILLTLHHTFFQSSFVQCLRNFSFETPFFITLTPNRHISWYTSSYDRTVAALLFVYCIDVFVPVWILSSAVSSEDINIWFPVIVSTEKTIPSIN